MNFTIAKNIQEYVTRNTMYGHKQDEHIEIIELFI